MTSDIIYAGSEAHSTSSLIGSIQIERPSPIVKADDLAYITFVKSDLDKQQAFLEDFGMSVASASDSSLYMRGVGTLPYFYAAHSIGTLPNSNQPKQKAGYYGLGFSVSTEAELKKLSLATKTPIENIDGPGGGSRVRLFDPDGFIVDVVWGRQPVERLETRSEIPPSNTQFDKPRINKTVRTELAPSPLERLGHCVLSVTDFDASIQWYMTHVGIVPTDVLCLEDGTPSLSFNRLDRGSKPADHHTLVLIRDIEAKYQHSAYETLDLDSVGQGQQYMKWKGWRHFWGMGRHTLGSQIFDYWLDPDGDELEHYADGDVFDDQYPTRYHQMDMGGTWAWGDDIPSKMLPKFKLQQIWLAIKALAAKKITKDQLGLVKKALSIPARPWIK